MCKWKSLLNYTKKVTTANRATLSPFKRYLTHLSDIEIFWGSFERYWSDLSNIEPIWAIYWSNLCDIEPIRAILFTFERYWAHLSDIYHIWAISRWGLLLGQRRLLLGQRRQYFHVIQCFYIIGQDTFYRAIFQWKSLLIQTKLSHDKAIDRVALISTYCIIAQCIGHSPLNFTCRCIAHIIASKRKIYP